MYRTSLIVISVLCFLARPAVLADDEDENIKKILTQLSKKLSSTREADRLAALEEAEKLGKKAGPIRKDLCSALGDSSPKVAIAAADALKAVWPEAHSTVTKITKAKPWPDAVYALEHLDQMKEDAHDALPVVLAYLKKIGATKDLNESARAAALSTALSTLIAIGQNDEALFPVLLSHANSASVQVRAKAIYGLGLQAEVHPEMRKKIVPGLTNALKVNGTKHVAIDALSRCGNDASTALSALRELKYDPVESVRMAAKQAIAAIEAKK